MSDDVILRYEKELAEDPKSRVFAPLAEAYRKAGRLDEAINTARVGLEAHPGYSAGLVVMGRALYEKRELDNAAEILVKAVGENPENYLGQKFLGKVLMDKGEHQGAMEALQAANLLSPEDDEVVRILEEIKAKAAAPRSMEYEAKKADSNGGPQIVTYEQKPMTIDGVELPPLPASEISEDFSFSDGDGEEPADIIPMMGEIKAASPAVEEQSQVPEVDEEVAGPAQVQGDKVEQIVQADVLEDLGPEAAAFIEEGEIAEEEILEIQPEEVLPSGEEAVEEEIPDPDNPGMISSTPPAPASGPETPFRKEDFLQEPNRQANETAHTAEGEGFSTETLADLYAQQGLTEKAVKIYEQILEETPDNDSVKSKLESLTAGVSDSDPIQEGLGGSMPPSTTELDAEGALTILEGMLENLERMKRS